MPLIQGKSDATRNKNIQELIESGYEPSQAEAIAYSVQRKNAKDLNALTRSPLELSMDDDNESAREYDINGWAEIKGNPISKVGVFPYTGSQIHPDLDPSKIYMVYRPESELSSQETINSFKLLPWTDEHTMLGEGMTPAEKKGIHGVIGQDVYFEDGYLKANLKVFSQELADLIDSGKKELSIGYRCLYDLSSGVYNGEKYDAIQREIRGNHIASVDEGRSGHDVAVLDHFKITFDSKDLKMPDFEKEDYKDKDGDMSKPSDSGKDEGDMSIEECREMLKKISSHLERMSNTKDEFEDNLEAEEINKSENMVEDVEPEDFVDRAEVTDADEEEEEKKELSEKAAKEGDAKDEDYSKQDGDIGKKSGMDSMKNVLKEISRRDALAEKLSNHIGTFDHKEKTLNEVARYGVKKLGIICQKGHEEAALVGYLKGARVSSVAIAQDSRRPSSNQIDAYLRGDK